MSRRSLSGQPPRPHVSGATPGHRYQPVMVYDRARGRTVLYCGDPSKTDTWEWDGNQWTEIQP